MKKKMMKGRYITDVENPSDMPTNTGHMHKQISSLFSDRNN